MRHLWPIKDRLDAAQTPKPATARPDDPYANDCAGFLHDCVIIDNAQPDEESGVAEMPFHLWPAQLELLGSVLSERLLLILKARQLGISWLVLAYALWLCLYRPGRLVLVFSIGQNEANEMLRRCHAMYWRLTPELRATLPTLIKDNTEEMAWSNGSRILSLPSRANAGSSYTASLAIMDEFAKNPRDAQIYTAVKPTIDGGGKLIILSSADGAGNLFAELVQRALQSIGRFTFRFLPWHARPDRDAAWYAAVAADAVDSSLMKQEYPATPEEAFAATEANAFLPSMALWDACREDLPPLGNREPLVLAADAGEVDDTFAVIAVSRHPSDKARIAARYVRIYEPGPHGIDFMQVEADILEFCRTHNVYQLCYDRYQLRLMMQRIGNQGVWCDEFKQAGARLESDKMLRDLIISRIFAHDGDLTLRTHVANANAEAQTDGRLRIVKRTHAKKIDATVALGMACHRLMTEFQL
jgi:hypothetical protein